MINLYDQVGLASVDEQDELVWLALNSNSDAWNQLQRSIETPIVAILEGMGRQIWRELRSHGVI